MKARVKIAIEASVKCSALQKKVLLKAANLTLRKLPKSLLARSLKHKAPYSMTVALVSPANIRRLNAHYRKKDKVTDVLSFSRLESPSPFPEVGDVLICLTRAKRQAREINCSLNEELARLTVHGVLHLFGYDHETNEKDAKRMFRLQESILESLRWD